MKAGDLIKIVTGYVGQKQLNNTGLIVHIERRHGVDCNRHSRAATVMTAAGKLVTWPLDSRYQFEVINESR